MNKEDILTDFSIHLLLKEEEVRDNELLFFVDRRNKDVSYDYYVLTIKKFVEIDNCVWDTILNERKEKINNLTDLITEKEIGYFQDYINNEFQFGYPDQVDDEGFVYGFSYGLNLSVDEIKSCFKDYLVLRDYNPNVYISYFQQYLTFLGGEKEVVDMQLKINNFYENSKGISPSIFSKLKDNFELNLQQELLKCTQNTNFQVIGGFDENGFILNYDETLKAIITSVNLGDFKKGLSLELEQHYALLKYNYYEYKIIGTHPSSNTKDVKKLEEEFKSLKDKNNGQITYLKKRGFSNTEIDRILNIFSKNRFDILNIRHIRNIDKIDYYRLFYFLFRFEFLEDSAIFKFDKQRDFTNLFLSEDLIDTNQYYKYHKEAINKITPLLNQKHHPFASIRKVNTLISKIQSELYFDIKLLNIPDCFKEYKK